MSITTQELGAQARQLLATQLGGARVALVEEGDLDEALLKLSAHLLPSGQRELAALAAAALLHILTLSDELAELRAALTDLVAGAELCVLAMDDPRSYDATVAPLRAVAAADLERLLDRSPSVEEAGRG